jgi:hypothetical protein
MDRNIPEKHFQAYEMEGDMIHRSPLHTDPIEGYQGFSEKLYRLKIAILEAIQEAIRDPQTATNLTYLIGSFGNEEISALLRFLKRSPHPSPTHLKEILFRLEFDRMRRSMDPSQKSVGIYFPTAAYRKNVGRIAVRLRNKGFNVFNIIGESCNDEVEKEKFTFFGGRFGGPEFIRSMDFLQVFIFPHIASYLPANARRIYFPHDMHDWADWAVNQGEGRFDETILREMIESIDYFFMPLKYDVERIEQRISACKKKFSIQKEVCLIPGGYIKLDRNLEYFEKNKEDSKTLIYATTVSGTDGMVGPLYHLQYSEKIIDEILKQIPDYELIFRPHPHTRKDPEVCTLVKKFKSRPNFVLDDNPSSYMAHYAKAAIMITDMSGTAYTYAFSTLRPVVFFNPHTDLIKKEFEGFRFFEDRGKVGFVVEDTAQMIQRINFLLENKGILEKQIRNYRDSVVFHLGTAEEYFTGQFDWIMENRRHPDWIYV